MSSADPPLDSRLSNDDLAPTTPLQRTWTVWNIAALWVGMAVCIPTYTLASGLVAKGWSWQASVGAIALGNLVVLLPMVLNAHAGTRYGIPFPVLVRASFGVSGANLPALLRAFVACGWFGINTYIGGSALAQVVRALFLDGGPPGARLPILGIEPLEFVCFLVFWGVQVAILMRGIESLKHLETWSAPFLILIGVALLAWAVTKTGSFGALLENPPAVGDTKAGFGSVLGAGLTSAVSFWGTLALNIPDFSRYARSQRDQVIGQALGLPLTMAFFAFIGAVVTNATMGIFGERIADPVVLLGRIGGSFTTVIAMVALLLATLTTNVAANIVGPANDFSNVSPSRVSFKMGCIITAVIGLIIMPWRLYNDAAAYLFTWLLGYGAMLGSVAGVMIADYWIIRRQRLSIDDLYRRDGIYRFAGGWNPIAVVALVAGIAPNIPGFLGALGVVTDLGTFWKDLYEWAWFVAFFVAAAVHLLGTTLFGKRP
jgi:NCS1 family nucleobase:cation symporter-1